MSAPVIEAKGLTKRYGQHVAVDGLDLTIRQGEIFGLLGPNGAGKTTTILLLLGLTEPSGGEVKVLGRNPLREPLEVKRRVGYLPDAVGFYDGMTAFENLAYTARLAGIAGAEIGARVDESLKRVRLDHVRNKRVSDFSRGMRQRLGIADLLVKQCELAILDEPTSGLDPQSTQELLDMILKLAADGMTIVLSSHMLAMVQSICTRVALFNAGKAALVGRVDDLATQVLGGSHVVEVEAQGCDAKALSEKLDGVTHVSRSGGDTIRIEADRDVRAAVSKAIVDAGGSLKRLSMDRTSLDEVYVRYFKEMHHEAA